MNWDEGSWDVGFWDAESTQNQTTNQPRKRTTMTLQAYFPTRLADQIIWLEKFRNKLAGHAPTLGITVARCEAAVADAECVVVLTEWRQYRDLTPESLGALTRARHIVDARNCLEPAQWRAAGWTYSAPGRP